MKRISLEGKSGASFVPGIVEPVIPAVTADYLREQPPDLVILLDKSLSSAEQWAEDLGFFVQQFQPEAKDNLVCRMLPSVKDSDEGNDPRIFEILCDRLAAASLLLDLKEGRLVGKTVVLATTPEAFFNHLPTPEQLKRAEIELTIGQTLPFGDLVDALVQKLDYDSEAVCETPGQIAVRGGIIDVYPLNDHRPYRIDFFGDEIESIRTFDPTTQRSEASVDRIVINSNRNAEREETPGAILKYLPEAVTWFLREPEQLEAAFPSDFQYPEKLKATIQPTFKQAIDRAGGERDQWIGIGELDTGKTIFGAQTTPLRFESESLAVYRHFPDESAIGMDRFESEQSARRQFLETLLDWQRDGYIIWMLSRNDGEESRLREILQSDPVLEQLQPVYRRGALHQGFKVNLHTPGALRRQPFGLQKGTKGWVVVTDSEIFGRYRRRLPRLQSRKLPVRTQVDQLLDFSELADGDTIVHLQHGLCLYRGLTTMDLRGRREEVISLEFAEGAMLHVPLFESHLLTRYVGLSKRNPKLGKLGSVTWERTRAAAEKATLDFAAELLHMQAQRDSAVGHIFSDQHPWLKEFENAFIFQETPDQLSAIQAAKEDMTRERPMDRLVCGDVGFGKTEVALRAAFMAVLDGKQVAMLVPTTVLCQQHFNTFRERMADYPVVIEMVSRFRTPQQNRQILKDLQQGAVDIVVGTHRLLSQDVSFRDLGLLIIDEEQRFGVKQKELLKTLRVNVEILTLSATPIPRTLYLALVGAREMSVIETPPRDRLPIQTIIKGYDKDLIKSAIQQEINRGGQVFYLHNRVTTIFNVAGRLEEWFPKLRIAVGHGQMDEGMLERTMTRFVASEYDILVCTTIIESGIDIPNCNTMIIEGADRFGLSQLYQLRGRVGRFKRQAYCYLLLHRKTHLKDEARKRLSSIRQYNQLGAGFRIAMRDLELRGAGNLLGAEQSGHIAGVGFDLYCQLLRQSIARLKGEPAASVIRASVRLDFIKIGRDGEDTADEEREALERKGGYSVLKAEQIHGERIAPISAYIPSDYIAETRLRIDFYRRLAMAADPEEIDRIEGELKDRFGRLPVPVQILIVFSQIRSLAEQKGIKSVETEGSRLKLNIAQSKGDKFVKIGSRFPRLNKAKPFDRLKEVRSYLKRYRTNEK